MSIGGDLANEDGSFRSECGYSPKPPEALSANRILKQNLDQQFVEVRWKIFCDPFHSVQYKLSVSQISIATPCTSALCSRTPYSTNLPSNANLTITPCCLRRISLRVLLVTPMWLLRRDVPSDRNLVVRNLPPALSRRFLGPLQTLRQEGQAHPPDPDDGRKDAIHNHVRPVRPGQLQPKAPVDGAERDERDAPPDVDIRHDRAASRLLEAQVVQQARERLQGQAADGDEPDPGVVAVHVLVPVGHPDPHGHGGQRGAQREDLPRGVQPDGDAAWEDADQHRAHGEEEREGQAAQHAMRGLDVGLETLSRGEVLACVPVFSYGII